MADSNKQIFDLFASDLRESGLGELFTVGSDGEPGGWLWNQIQSGVDSYEAFSVAFQNTDVFKERFSVIVEQKRRAAKGEPVQVMTPSDVLEFEKAVTETFSEAGIPSWFYDEPNDFSEYILRDISASEITRRVTQTFEYIDTAPPEVREAFSQFYGVGQGAGALAAFVLDPEKTAGRIEKAAKTAFVGGMAKKFEIDLNKSRAQEIAELGITDLGTVNTFTELNRRAALFRDSRFDDSNISIENEGIDAEFLGDTDAQMKINRKIIGREALNRSSTGGAVTTNEGIVGATTAGGR